MFWNSGDIPINKDDIRLPITFILNKANRILDFKVTKQKDSLISNFMLSQINSNSLQLEWKYFDPKHAFSFQILYEGTQNSNFEIQGTILGISEFNKVKLGTKGTILWKFDDFFIIFVTLLTFFVSIRTFILSYKYKIKLWLPIFSAISLIVILWAFWHYFFYKPDLPF